MPLLISLLTRWIELVERCQAPLGDMTVSANPEGNCALGRLVDLRIQTDILTWGMIVTGEIVGSYFLTRAVVAGRGDQPNCSLLLH